MVLGRAFQDDKGDEVLSCLLVQLVVQSSECAKIAVDVGFHHILEDVAHLVIPALLRCRLAVSFRHVRMN